MDRLQRGHGTRRGGQGCRWRLRRHGVGGVLSPPSSASLPAGASSGKAHEQHGDWGQADDTLRHTAQDQMVEPPPPMGP